MGEMIRQRSTSYARYEELINRRDNLLKEAFQYQRAYTREFGDRIVKLFEKKIECIRKKKTIEFCQAALNHGNTVDQAKLQEYLAKEMAAFQAQLEEMVRDNEMAKNASDISEKDLLELKRIYHRLAKRIHPDMNPGVTASKVLLDLWHRVSVAYECNDLKELQELEVLVMQALENADIEDLDIPDIEDKIADLEKEITKIMETDPYLYQFILNDENAVADKNSSLDAEYRTYEDYGKELDTVLEGIIGSGVKITWKMD